MRARVVSQSLKHESLENDPDAVFTVTTLRAIEVIKSSGSALAAGDTFRVELPGGQDGTTATWLPGTPAFAEGNEVVLFLAPRRWRDADFLLTELGLSKFDSSSIAAAARSPSGPSFPMKRMTPCRGARNRSRTLRPGAPSSPRMQ